MNIFIADDDQDDRTLFADALSEYPLYTQVTAVNDGVQLMAELYSGNPLPDVIFLDLKMPMMDGFECLSDIRDVDSFQNIPVIIYSTSFLAEDIIRLREMGATLYLQKPSSYDDLKRVLHGCLENLGTKPVSGTTSSDDFVLHAQ